MGRAPTNTKQKLIETAMSLIWQNSYGSVSVDDICTKADVHKGSFYHYFPSKIELTLCALDAFYEGSKPMFDAVFDSAIAPRERFKKLCELAYDKQKETKDTYGRVCGCPFMALGSEMSGQEKLIQKKTSETFGKHVLYYQTAIEDMIKLGELPSDTNAHKKASQIYAYIMGHIMMARIQNDLEPLKDNLRTGIFNILQVSEDELEHA